MLGIILIVLIAFFVFTIFLLPKGMPGEIFLIANAPLLFFTMLWVGMFTEYTEIRFSEASLPLLVETQQSIEDKLVQAISLYQQHERGTLVDLKPDISKLQTYANLAQAYPNLQNDDTIRSLMNAYYKNGRELLEKKTAIVSTKARLRFYLFPSEVFN